MHFFCGLSVAPIRLELTSRTTAQSSCTVFFWLRLISGGISFNLQTNLATVVIHTVWA